MSPAKISRTPIESVTNGCHHCASLRKIPQVVKEQTSSDPPDAIDTRFLPT